MDQIILEELKTETEALREAGLYKEERVLTSPQGAAIAVEDMLEGDAIWNEIDGG